MNEVNESDSIKVSDAERERLRHAYLAGWMAFTDKCKPYVPKSDPPNQCAAAWLDANYPPLRPEPPNGTVLLQPGKSYFSQRVWLRVDADAAPHARGKCWFSTAHGAENPCTWDELLNVGAADWPEMMVEPS